MCLLFVCLYTEVHFEIGDILIGVKMLKVRVK